MNDASLSLQLLKWNESTRTALEIRGRDRLKWLSGLITADLSSVHKNALYTLLLDKRGKIQTDAWVVEGVFEDVLYFLVPSEKAKDVAESLEHFLIMEDVEITLPQTKHNLVFLYEKKQKEALSSVSLLVESVAKNKECLASSNIKRGDVFGALFLFEEKASLLFDKRLNTFCEPNQIELLECTEADWNAFRFTQAWPEFGVDFDASMYPQEAGLERVAVSWSKGCYLGQEVVCMLEMRGQTKRKLALLEGHTETLEKGLEVLSLEGAEKVGEIKSFCVFPETKVVRAYGLIKYSELAKHEEFLVGSDKMHLVHT